MKIFLLSISIILTSIVGFLLGAFVFPQENQKLNEKINTQKQEIESLSQESSDYQSLFANMKEEKEEWENKANELTKNNSNQDQKLKKSQKERKLEKEAAYAQFKELNSVIATLEQQKHNLMKVHTAEIDELVLKYKQELESKRKEILLAESAGFKRGVNETLARFQKSRKP
ncbi:MAG: hypothetical protein VX130_02440 [Verrucomicrobiota bacterium]|nr:hypothetical protein [Verrucomicrobiota bacterium]